MSSALDKIISETTLRLFKSWKEVAGRNKVARKQMIEVSAPLPWDLPLHRPMAYSSFLLPRRFLMTLPP